MRLTSGRQRWDKSVFRTNSGKPGPAFAIGVVASRFQAKFQSIRTGPFDEKLSTDYKLDIPIRGDDLKSCIGRFPTGSARWLRFSHQKQKVLL